MSRYAFYKCLTLSLMAHLVLGAAILKVSRTTTALPSGGKVGTEIVYMIQLVDPPALTPPENHTAVPVRSPAPMPPKASTVQNQREKVPLTTPMKTSMKEKSLSSDLSLASLEENHPPAVAPIGRTAKPSMAQPQPVREKSEAAVLTRELRLPPPLEPTGMGQSLNPAASQSASANTGRGSPQGSAAENEKYRRFLAEVRALLEWGKRYPWLARLKQLEGTVQVGFQISPEGAPHNVRVLTSSSYRILDEAAVLIVKRVSRFPQPPDGSNVQLVLPLDFHLTR